MTRRTLLRTAAVTVASGLFAEPPGNERINVAWSEGVRVSRTQASVQVVANPLLRRSSPIHDRAYAYLRRLGAEHVRYVPWYPYPRLAVAELRAPSASATSWDFEAIDPLVVDFMQATAGHAPILNFSTTPAWMWKTAPVTVPPDPDAIDFGYTQGTDLAVAPSTVGDYYRRLVSWYACGGFSDELGRRHGSRHHFRLELWEVLNEIQAEHRLTPQRYTELYDEIVTQIRSVSPRTRFIGLALANTGQGMIDYVRHFLDHRNHRPGVPLDWISYHFYAQPSIDTPAGWGPSSRSRVNAFLHTVDQLEAIRARHSPHTHVAVDEVGTLLGAAATQPVPETIPPAYWNFAAATFAYLVAQLALRGVDLVSESQLVGYPGQYPSATMLDWSTGLPNARYRVLALLLEHLRSGVVLCRASASSARIFGLGLRTSQGSRKVLLINRDHQPVHVVCDGLRGARVERVDGRSGGGPATRLFVRHDSLALSGYAVAVATLAVRSRPRP